MKHCGLSVLSACVAALPWQGAFAQQAGSGPAMAPSAQQQQAAAIQQQAVSAQQRQAAYSQQRAYSQAGSLASSQSVNQATSQTGSDDSVTVEAQSDGKCRDARPGDIVNFALTIEGIDAARAVYGELQLREGHATPLRTGGLPLPDYRNLAGGGLGLRDPQRSDSYHFSFRVPEQILSGVYRGTGVVVTAERPATDTDRDYAAQSSKRNRDREVDVTRHARDEVRMFCLRVFSNFGANNRPLVTDFQPGAVDKQAPPPVPAPLR